jgi:hypothetical protein
VPVVLRLPLGHSHSYGFLLTHSTANRACELWQSRCFAPPAPSGNRRRSSAIPPSRPGLRGPPRRPVHRAFFLASRIEEAPHAPRVGAGAAPPPKSPPRPASGSHRLPHTHTHTLGQVGEQYGPSTAPFGRARCLFLPLPRPYSAGGAARGSHNGQFPCFGPHSCFTAFVLDIPNGFWPLDRAVGRAYIREAVASTAQRRAPRTHFTFYILHFFAFITCNLQFEISTSHDINDIRQDFVRNSG